MKALSGDFSSILSCKEEGEGDGSRNAVERAVLYAALEKDNVVATDLLAGLKQDAAKYPAMAASHPLFHTPEIAKWEQVADNKEISGHALFTGAEWMGKEADVVKRTGVKSTGRDCD